MSLIVRECTWLQHCATTLQLSLQVRNWMNNQPFTGHMDFPLVSECLVSMLLWSGPTWISRTWLLQTHFYDCSKLGICGRYEGQPLGSCQELHLLSLWSVCAIWKRKFYAFPVKYVEFPFTARSDVCVKRNITFKLKGANDFIIFAFIRFRLKQLNGVSTSSC